MIQTIERVFPLPAATLLTSDTATFSSNEGNLYWMDGIGFVLHSTHGITVQFKERQLLFFM